MQNFQFKIELKISWNILKNYDEIHQFHSPAVSRDAIYIFQNYSEPLRLLDLEADFISLSPDPSCSLSDPLDLDLDFDLERSFSSLLNDDKQH